MPKSKVYFIKEITPENLIKVYEALGIELTGKVGVKVSTGEDGAKGYLKADLIAPLVKKTKWYNYRMQYGISRSKKYCKRSYKGCGKAWIYIICRCRHYG